MTWLVEPALIALVLTDLLLVGAGRLALCIRVVAFQGLAVGLLPLALPGHVLVVETYLLAVVSVVLKAIVFPRLLTRALHAAEVRTEADPYVGYGLSVLLGVGMLGLAMWLGPRLQLAPPGAPRLLVPVALFSVLVGLFLIVARKTALNQVIGYLVLENGVFLFGITLAREEPVLIEMGVLLDVFVAVFVFGIAIFHISREFDHIEVDQLTTLKD